MRTVKQITDLMGYDPDTNLKSYVRFQTNDLEKASDLEEIAWTDTLRIELNGKDIKISSYCLTSHGFFCFLLSNNFVIYFVKRS